ncbi:MAG: LptF/LptG family permease [Phycisphaerae bacterium]|nr:LptF/LptG family permease [Phycisphaerae bacterium]
MLYTLHSYIGRELAKVFAIAAISLTVVLSLGGLLKPLRDQGVSAVQLFQLLAYVFPVMMTFSLPVAALLSTTLVYGRLSADNELTACRASGISMWALVMPGIALGVVVMFCNLMLSNWFIPRCAQRAEHVVRQDLQEILYNKLKHDGELRYGRQFVVTAERVEKTGDGRMVLGSPSITELAQGRKARTTPEPPAQITWCRTATLVLDQEAGTVTIVPRDAVGVRWGEASVPFRAEEAAIQLPLGSITKDEVSFKTYGELMALRARPEEFYRVDKLFDQCRQLGVQKLLYDEMYQTLHDRSGGGYMMKYEDRLPDLDGPAGTAPGGVVLRDVRVQADHAEWLKANKPEDGLSLGLENDPESKVTFTLLGEPVNGRAPERVQYTAKRAKMLVSMRDAKLGPMVDVEFIGDYTRKDLATGAVAHDANRRMIERLLPDARLAQQVNGMTRKELESLPLTQNLRRAVKSEVARLERDIMAELNSRGAFAVAGLVLVMLGAALGVIFRSGHVLVAFGVAAIPALIAILMVVMGNKIATSSSSSIQQLGVLFIWSGNILTAGLDVFVYWKMLKH